ncbi:YL1 nuclear protein C-terminal domain-containing protein [Toxoplasma gondii GAB2-2007-GAL-DOM2]|uniref:YL1 nuclear protein C-terminal domain-containing protein n=3 Tax=Toxoplasma gondii TaxID=5811 RepID=A0A086LHJ2_TOXGO|nr:YL1 nuclear protein C-terminal domain-containing protein [Toxoplasma gondii GAB2-2007-GAL-DOM2]KFG56110.1 YL1 nuclear protein C-terminal domain-containing protein [Toxoplasma gondii FOU]PUA91618.1 YL1 nuclear protein C-terminal domain-containing protein [Toxoplasma gondii TgCATBr9]
MGRPGRRSHAALQPESEARNEVEEERETEEASPAEGKEEEGEEEEDGEEEDDEDEDEETSSEEEEVGIALQLPVRSTRGHSYQRLVGDALREDQEFWNHSTWAEEDDEDYNCSEGEEVYADIVDSDFDRAEDEESSDEETAERKRSKDGETKRERRDARDIVEDDEERAKKRQKRGAFQNLWKKTQQQRRQAEAKKAGEKGRERQTKRVSFEPAAESEGDFDAESEDEKGDSQCTQPRSRRKASGKKQLIGAEGDDEDGERPPASRRRTRDSTRQHTRCVARRLEEEELHRIRKERSRKVEAERAGRDKQSGFREPTLEEHLAEARITEARNVASLMVIEEKEEARKLRYVDMKKNIYKGDFDTYISWASWLIIGDAPPEEDAPAATETNSAESAAVSPKGDSLLAQTPHEIAGTKLSTEQRRAFQEEEETRASPGALERIKREEFQNQKGDSHGIDVERSNCIEKRIEVTEEENRAGSSGGSTEGGKGAGAQQPTCRPRAETPTTVAGGDEGAEGDKRPGETPEDGKDQEEWSPNLDDYAMELRMFTDGKFPDIYHQEPPPPPPKYVCPISGLEAKYLDPLTGVRYATTHAFKCLREAYHRLREQQLFQALHQATQLLDAKVGELGLDASTVSTAGPSASEKTVLSSHAGQHDLLDSSRGALQNRGDASTKLLSSSPQSRSGDSFAGATASDMWIAEDDGKKGQGRRGAKVKTGPRGKKERRKAKAENYAFAAV